MYGWHRSRVEVVGGRGLDDLAEVHDRDAVGDVAHDGEVVRDEEVGQAELVLQVSSRLMTCAWIETSSAETGSSATISSRLERERARDRRCAGAGRRRTRAGSG